MNRNKIHHLLPIASLILLIASCTNVADTTTTYTRGIGIYPGAVDEYRGPVAVADNESYRNVAKQRRTDQSSSYDYNLTAHLATDGVVTTEQPAFLCLFTKDDTLKRREREWMFDGKIDSKYSEIRGSENFMQLELHNGSQPVSSASLRGYVLCDANKPQSYALTLEASSDGKQWTVLGKQQGKQFADLSSEGFFPRPVSEGKVRNYFVMRCKFPLENYAFYRFSMSAPSAEEWSITDWDLFNDGGQVLVTTQQYFTSNWMSLGNRDEWISVDFGAPASFDNIRLHWVNKATKGSLLTSFDGEKWNKLCDLPGGESTVDEIAVKGEARYIKLFMEETADGNPFILSEIEVFGKGGIVPQPQPSPQATDARCDLSGGNWRLQRASQVRSAGETISKTDFEAVDWVPATVPGTVLMSYANAGAIPDGTYGDEQLLISDSYFISNFWYRNSFDVPASFAGKELFLNFDGINWKANIFVNGIKVGRIEGAFTSAKFNVTNLLKVDESNALAVEIIRNDNYGAVKEQNRESADQNGGILGYDNPTFHATIGWDWIPTVRGRNIGIWNDVYITANAYGITIEEPFVTTDLPLPSTAHADISAQMLLVNHRDTTVSGTLSFAYGDAKREMEVVLPPCTTQKVSIDSLRIEHPRLWMPKGYGEPNLYDVNIEYRVNGQICDSKSFKSGVREMSYAINDGALDIYINNRRLIGNGGNWGFPEVNLNYRAREYDIAVAYHADMNFTLIRDWVGMTGDEEFYDACDRHGVMIWQDFWLANPWDGPIPNDNDMFMANARDYVKRIRNHPAMALYCGRNEGYPPQVLNEALGRLVKELHPTLTYIPHSSADAVSGEGPYCYQTPEAYFSNPKGFAKFHSERGMTNVMTQESMQQMLPEKDWWPQTSLWGVHDYTLESAQKAQEMNNAIEKGFGEAESMEEFTDRAQWFNYEGYRAMFEARSAHRKGLLLWMSHSCWPSMTWQTYDYYFEPDAAYFACKKATAPIHIQWNPISHKVEVVNNCAGNFDELTASAQIIKMDGTVRVEKEITLKSTEDSTTPLFELSFGDELQLSDVYFIKLKLQKGDSLMADNFYWRGKENGNYRALLTMEKGKVTIKTTTVDNGDHYTITSVLSNKEKVPALMLRLHVVGKRTGERILPAFYSDNYFSLMAGEEKTVTISLKKEDARGEKPVVNLTGFNLEQ